MVHASITTPRSATLIFSWSALTDHYVPGEKLAQVSVITSGSESTTSLQPQYALYICLCVSFILPLLHVLTAASQIQLASIMIFVCLTFNLLRSRSDVLAG
ncbi:hypothetical protein K438DRAFT_1877890 [Mycena galopus ATCC 62051]|nr:hypothetical protein K438DRAFT_1877890 [Mycena galopus ATCC 62051]